MTTVTLAYTPQAGNPRSYSGACASYPSTGGTPTLSFTGKASGGSGASNTFTAFSIGTAASNRKVVVIVSSIVNSLTAVAPTCTIGGVSATLDAVASGGNDGNGTYGFTAIFSLDVASGTTANIVVAAGTSTFDYSIHVYAVYGVSTASATNTFSGQQTTAPTDLSVAVSGSGGAIIAGGLVYDLSPVSVTWTGLTDNGADNLYGSDLRTGASNTFAPAATTAFRGTLSPVGTRTGSRQAMAA
jgi:hypothetical protein